MGTLVVFLTLYVFDKKTSLILGFSISFILITFDLIRLMWPAFNRLILKIYGPLMRIEESHKPSGQMFYVLGLCFAVLFLPQVLAVQAILILAWMDPIAGLVGGRFGKTSWNSILNKIFSDARPEGLDLGLKTIEGSLAGFLMAILAGISAWMLCEPQLNVQNNQISGYPFNTVVFAFSFLGALIAMIAESWPSQWDDNINIPFWTGLILWGTSIAWGIPL
jgi:dolichol kinase